MNSQDTSKKSPTVLAPPAKIMTPSTHSEEDDEIVWKNGATGPNVEKGQNNRTSNGLDADLASKWRFTGNGQIIDGNSGSKWDIADEVLKLQIKDNAEAPKKVNSPGAVRGAETPERVPGVTSRRSTDRSLLDAPAEVDQDKAHTRGSSFESDDVLSSGGSSSVATPAQPPKSNGAMVNGKRADHMGGVDSLITSPTQAGDEYPGIGGADDYSVTSNRAYYMPNGVHSPVHSLHGNGMSNVAPVYPHHIQTAHLGHVPPPQFSPHHPHAQRGGERHGVMSPQQQMGGFDYRTGRKEEVDYSMVNGRSENGVAGSRINGVNNGAPSFASPDHPSLYDMAHVHRGSYTAGGNGQVYPPAVVSPPPIPGAAPYTLPGHHYGALPHAYSPYGAHTNGYDLISPTAADDQRAIAALLASRSQFRGHQHSASDSAALRESIGLAGAEAALHLQHQQPTSPLALSHSHSLSLSLSHSPYSPQLPTSPYHPHSPGPYANYYAHLPPPLPHHQQHQDMINAMAPMSPSYGGAYSQLMDPAGLGAGGNGPSANNRKLGLYKTELCRSWEEKGSCRYGGKCQFAHGEDEIRKVARHPKYKTEICRTFWVSGSCPYGKRCCFIHTELPTAGAPGAPGVPTDNARPTGTPNGNSNNNAPPTPVDGRARSMSTNSDPNDAPSSLLARISAKAHANNTAAAAAAAITRSNDPSPANSQFNDSATATAVANAYAQYGRPNQSNAPRMGEKSSDKDSFGQNGLSGYQGSSSGNGHSGGMHHRVSASVDYGGHGRQMLGEALELGGRGLGHQRNPSASSVVHGSYHFGNDSLPSLNSRTPDPRLSGHSTPFGNAGDSTSITPARVSPAPPPSRSFMHERSSSVGIQRSHLPTPTYAAMDRAWA